MALRINDMLVAQGKTQVLELSFEGVRTKVYIQLVTRATQPSEVSKAYVTTCGMSMARAFDWLAAFELAINIK